MGEEFEAAGVYGGNWWNSSSGKFGSSHCNSFINMNDHMVSFGLTAAGELVDMKGGTRSSEDSSDDGGATTIDSTLQMMGIGLSSSSSTTDWNDQPLIRGGGRAESNYKPIFQEDLNYHQETGVNDFSPHAENFTMQANQVGFNSIQQPSLSSDHFRTTCQGLATFPISTSSYVYPTTLMQTLFDNNSPPDQSAYDDGSINYSSNENNYRTNLSEFLPSLPKFSSTVKPKQHVSGQMNLSNNTPFCNASSVSALNDIRASFLSSAHSQLLSMTFEEKPKCPDLTPKEEIRNSGSVVKKICNEPAFKRPRLETPSPLPTFKVRKEKLGDRITALQQLVSPFGKTDTASVLHEAIEYIKLLHDQVNVLSTQYMKNGVSMQCEQIPEKVKETEGAKQDLKSRGLCLVPVSSTFPVTAETRTDFWTPNFVGTFR